MSRITFGTSGWRAVLAEDFTFANVRIAVAAVARHLRREGSASRGVVVAGDRRFFSERFQECAAGVLAGAGVPVFLCPVGTPTPVVSFEIRRRGAAGSINFTASHNPFEYQGLKFNGADGGPAPEAVTRAFEAEAAAVAAEGQEIPQMPLPEARAKGLLVDADPRADYFRRVREIVDFDVLRRAHLRVVYDALHGNGAGYTDALLSEAGVEVRTLHGERDPYFGGKRPEPGAEELEEAVAEQKSRPAHLVLANDGDADRFGVVDADGTFCTPNEVAAILLNHFLHTRPWKGAVVRTLATTHLLDAIAAKNGLPLREVPVGFKYIAEAMAKEPVLIGAEESGGLTVYGHVPEKDGVLACLLLAEVVAHAGRNLGAVLRSIARDYGTFYNGRLDRRLTPELQDSLKARLQGEAPATLAGVKVTEVLRRDGVKLILENGDWMLLRFSGTEPLVRCYLEARTPERFEALRAAGEEILRSPA